ncbi:hypothetical protein AcV5_005929 [Taiwanofungus camphoratus]|nr:hypothetical protein AcW2_004370 [Antrodia cinnamomea]KAI0933913.1 hypothetical protein AcV5_005929 [Antrodia cinnamomea]
MVSTSLTLWSVSYLIICLILVVCVSMARSVQQRVALCEQEKHDKPQMSRRRSSPLEIATKAEISVKESEVICQGTKQPYDAFLVLDVEATCMEGAVAFNYPNEIIEWPVCLLRWKDKTDKGTAKELEIVDEFRSFVKPTWKPRLSQFCTNLTGITQKQVDSAPAFPQVLETFEIFLEENGLIEPKTGRRLVRYCWCSDGPFDIRDFVVKQCFISKIGMPAWIKGDVLDVRSAVNSAFVLNRNRRRHRHHSLHSYNLPIRLSLSIPRQLEVLSLSPFEGRQHSGIDDARNITRILVELAKRGLKLEPNTAINPNRRWPWMGKRGKILNDLH